jgi:hypothetical protein
MMTGYRAILLWLRAGQHKHNKKFATTCERCLGSMLDYVFMAYHLEATGQQDSMASRIFDRYIHAIFWYNELVAQQAQNPKKKQNLQKVITKLKQ